MNTAQKMVKLAEARAITTATGDLTDALREIYNCAALAGRWLVLGGSLCILRRKGLQQALEKQGFTVKPGLRVEW